MAAGWFLADQVPYASAGAQPGRTTEQHGQDLSIAKLWTMRATILLSAADSL